MKRFLFLIVMTVILCCVFALTVSAVTTYDDAPVRTKYQALDEDIVEFYDGFTCPVSYVFKDTDWIDRPYGSDKYSFNKYFDFEYINGKTGKSYTFEDVRGFDIPEGIKSVAIYAGREMNTVKWISFPGSITSLAGAIFQGNTGLEECVFEFDENHSITKFPGYTFYGCKSLKAFSMPDCFTRIDDVGTFTGCNNMTAVYLSKNITEWSSGGGGSRNATFDDCYNLYFVNEQFTYDAIPEKPEVYYFPANLETMTNQSIFRECRSLNNVLVFGEKLTTVPNEYMFQNGPANKVVFLGDMTTVNTKWWGKTTHVFFANPNDVDETCVTFTGGKTAVFCHAEGNTTHLKEKSMSTEANCIYPEMTADYCFCGAIMGDPQTVGVALGHAFGTEYHIFASLTEKGYTCMDCSRCDHTEKVEHNRAVLVELGYSVKTFDTENGASFENGYSVDGDLLAKYEAAKGVDVSFGLAFNAKEGFTFDGTLDAFKLSYNISGAENSPLGAFVYKINYADEAQLDAQVVIGVYAVEEGEAGEELIFVNEQDGDIEAVSYNSVINK